MHLRDPRTQPMTDQGMAGMDHDMSPMGHSHSRAELAFLFPDGNDKGWSKLENGVQHNMAPEIPTARDAQAAGYRRAGPFIPGRGERKGRWIANSGYLLHVWTVPSYTDPLGVFAHMNPLLTCGDGTYYTDDHDITNQWRVP